MNIRYRLSHYFTLSHPLLGSGLRNYLHVLAKNNFCIDPRFSLKLIFSFATVLFWTPLRLLENALLYRKIQNTQVKEPLIILGHPRSGTTFLHYLLAADPAMAYSRTYEVFMPRIFYFFGKYIGAMMDPLMPRTRAMDNMGMGAFKPTMDEFALANLSDASLCHGFYFPKNINRYFNKYVTFSAGGNSERAKYKKTHLYFAKKSQLTNPGKRLIIKSAATASRIKELLEIFPDARFIHIYRNPYQVYLSNERLYEKILPLFGFHKTSNQAVEEFIINSYRDYHLKWFAEKTLIPPGRLVEFSFEDFVQQPLPILTSAYRELKITFTKEAQQGFENIAGQYSKYQKNTYKEISSDVKEKLVGNWAFCFHAWNYQL